MELYSAHKHYNFELLEINRLIIRKKCLQFIDIKCELKQTKDFSIVTKLGQIEYPFPNKNEAYVMAVRLNNWVKLRIEDDNEVFESNLHVNNDSSIYMILINKYHEIN
jgi:hypothetical protein